MLNYIIYNNDDPAMIREITDRNLSSLEEICMKAVRVSLELAIVPIRKFLIIFLIYMRFLFGKDVIPPVEDSKAKMYFESQNIKKNKKLLYLKEYQDLFLCNEQTCRFKLKTNHPVELFYKRHMSQDQPIP